MTQETTDLGNGRSKETIYMDDGSIFVECWYLNDRLHREDGPAVIEYNEDGSIYGEYWCINGKEHREDGPASIYYNEDGSISGEYWYINGDEITPTNTQILLWETRKK